MDISQKIVEKYNLLSFDDLQDNIIDTTKKFILDTIGVALAGWTAPGINNIFKVIKKYKSSGKSGIIGMDDKFGPMDAAFINSALSHALDFDDTLDEAATHACATVFPSALAIGEELETSGKELILSMVLGIDMVCRLSLAATTPLSWIRTSTCGSFGSAIAAGKMLRLDRNGLLNALGITYSQTSGNAQCLIDGALSKKIQPAFASKAGVTSALLANSGITGAKEIFEGKFGFFNLYEKGMYNRDILIKDLGQHFMIEQLSIKPYPTCRMTHSSIDVALKILKKLPPDLDPVKEIEKIEVKVCKMSKEMVGGKFVIRTNPQVDAQFSIPYNVSLVFTKKEEPFLDDISDDVIKSHKWDNLVNRIIVLHDKNLDERNIHKATMKVTLKNGKVLEDSVSSLRGSPKNPLSWEECVSKFKKCVSLGRLEYTANEIDSIINNIMNLENIDNVSLLFK